MYRWEAEKEGASSKPDNIACRCTEWRRYLLLPSQLSWIDLVMMAIMIARYLIWCWNIDERFITIWASNRCINITDTVYLMQNSKAFIVMYKYVNNQKYWKKFHNAQIIDVGSYGHVYKQYRPCTNVIWQWPSIKG